MTRQDVEVVRAASEAVACAASTDEACAALRSILERAMPCDRVTVVRFGESTAAFSGTSDQDTFYQTGSQVGYGITNDVTRIMSTLLLGHAAVVRFRDFDIGLLGFPLEEEGLQAAVAAPLTERGVVLAALVVSSTDPDPYGAGDAELLEQVARATQARLLELAGSVTD